MENIDKSLSKVNKALMDMSATAPPEDKDVYNCSICRDSGYVLHEGVYYRCPCRSKAELAQRQQAAGLTKRLARMRFDNFDLKYYPEDLQLNGHSYRSLAQRALQDCKELAKGDTDRGLLLEGDVGCGKTHLAASIANSMVEQGKDALFLVVPEFLDQLKASYRRENAGMDESEIIERAYSAKLLILDDMGAHNFTDWVRNKIFTILNHRYNKNLPCVITTNLDLYEMNESIGERTTSRLVEMCRLHKLCSSDRRISLGISGKRV